MIAPSPTTTGAAPGSRPRAGRPRMQKSSTCTSSPSCTLGNRLMSGSPAMEADHYRLRQHLQLLDHRQARGRVRDRLPSARDRVDKVRDLLDERLAEIDLRQPRVAGADRELVLGVGLETAEVGVQVTDVRSE